MDSLKKFARTIHKFAMYFRWDHYFTFTFHTICFSLICFFQCYFRLHWHLLTFLFLFYSVVDHLELREKSTEGFGLSSSILCHAFVMIVVCQKSWLLVNIIHCSDNAPRTVQGKDVNRRVVYAASEMGIGREDISKFCEILNMAFSISKDMRMPFFKRIVKLSRWS